MSSSIDHPHNVEVNEGIAPNTVLKRRKTDLKDHIALLSDKDPWAPSVLSLDGGGIRGLSELLILHEIIEIIQRLVATDGEGNPFSLASEASKVDGPVNSRPFQVLPCYLFDYIFGTSTGGLIAVMLGRLRMSVDDAIKAYMRFGNKVFGPNSQAPLLRSTRLEEAILDVVKENCLCHTASDSCKPREERLRQYDFAEIEDPAYLRSPTSQNHTCKTALVAVRKVDGLHRPHIFRSYYHRLRFDDTREWREYNSTESKPPIKIWEACRGTSAAPGKFHYMKIGNDVFLDGGVGFNNPTKIAWNEARWRSNAEDPEDGNVAMHVSIGCGEKGPIDEPDLDSRTPSNLRKFKGRMKRYITETNGADDEIYEMARAIRTPYFRLNVPPVKEEVSLCDVGTCECKKEPKQQGRWSSIKKGLKQIFADDSSASSARSSEQIERPKWYTKLESEAQDADVGQRKGAFKPRKYNYTTYNTILDRTVSYYTSDKVSKEFVECATDLLFLARCRQRQDPEKWKRFLRHPHPLYNNN